MFEGLAIFDERGFVDLADKSDFDEQAEAKRKNPLKVPKRQIDFAALITQLRTDTGATDAEIAEACGLSASYLFAVRSEKSYWDQAEKAIRLLGIFTLNTDRDIPLLGDYHNLGDEC